MKNKIEDLRNHLFEVIEQLKDEETPMDINRAKAVAHVAGTIIESAKIEVKYLATVKDGSDDGSGFLTVEPRGTRLLPETQK